MKTIYKYPLFPARTTIKLPEHYKVLTVQSQKNELFVWVEVDTDKPFDRMVYFDVYGTGRAIPDDPGSYIGTAQIYQGDLVWHVYAQGDAKTIPTWPAGGGIALC